MATSNDYLMFILDLLREVSGVTYKRMMGEVILYKNNIIFGGIYDNRFLVKNTKSMVLTKFKEIIPYKNAKAMLLIDIEDPDKVKEIVDLVYQDLKSN